MISLVQTGFRWLGDQVVQAVNARIDRKLNEAGAAWLARSRALAPRRTGRLAAEEDYQVADRTLVLIMGAPYDIFQEFGTRFIRPRPHVRPALLEMNRIFGTDVEMVFNRPGGGVWGGMFANEGSFVAPKNLTAKQRAHVRQHLIPVSRRLHKGAVKRAKMRVRHFGG